MDAVKLWNADAVGPYIDLKVAQKKDISVNFTDYWPAGETLPTGTAVWSAPTGVTFSGNVVDGLIAKVYVRGDIAGEYNCSLVATSASGNYVEPFNFRVIAK